MAHAERSIIEAAAAAVRHLGGTDEQEKKARDAASFNFSDFGCPKPFKQIAPIAITASAAASMRGPNSKLDTYGGV